MANVREGDVIGKAREVDEGVCFLALVEPLVVLDGVQSVHGSYRSDHSSLLVVVKDKIAVRGAFHYLGLDERGGSVLSDADRGEAAYELIPSSKGALLPSIEGVEKLRDVGRRDNLVVLAKEDACGDIVFQYVGRPTCTEGGRFTNEAM